MGEGGLLKKIITFVCFSLYSVVFYGVGASNSYNGIFFTKR